MFTKNSKIYVAGHNGLVGSAIVRELKRKGYKRIITASKKKLDLTNPTKTLQFLKQKKPVFIFIAAAKVGGIYSNNNFKADYIYQNLSITFISSVKKNQDINSKIFKLPKNN